MNKNSKYTAPRTLANRKAPMTQARAAYLIEQAFARECNECFTFGTHLPHCAKAE